VIVKMDLEYECGASEGGLHALCFCDIGYSVGKRGRPPAPYPRAHGVYVRFSDTEWGALVRAFAAEYPVVSRRPTLPEAIRDLLVAHASAVLGVEVTRSALQHAEGGVPDWKRWRLARAVRAAAPRRRKLRR
jgi:hypothetical protein